MSENGQGGTDSAAGTVPPISCFLIGSDTLLMECGDMLLRGGHDVRGVISAEARVRSWAEALGLTVLHPEEDIRSAMAAQPFDYLFAITYLSIIPDEILDLPARGAVNFHDGPLPSYAGLNTPVWALLNGEESYGITWHRMTSGVDKGDILEQQIFPVSPSETALSLNTKCLAAASETFPVLVQKLATGSEEPKEQDLTQRSYFGKYQRPPAACTLDWNKSASELEAFVRALTFGPYPKPLVAAKTHRADGNPTPVLVSAVEVVDGSGAPGTVLSLADDALVVAAADGALAIRAGSALTGEELDPPPLARGLGVDVGDALDTSGSTLGRHLGKADERLCRREDFWLRRLIEAQPPEVVLAASGGSDPDWASVGVVTPEGFKVEIGTAALSALCVVLARTGRTERFDLALSASLEGELRPWYSSVVPLRIELDTTWSTAQMMEALGAELEITRNRGSFLYDLIARDPRLGGNRGGWTSPVGFSLDGETPEQGSVLHLSVAPDGNLTLGYDRSRMSPDAAASVAASLGTCLADMHRDPSAPWTALDLVPEDQRTLQLVEWNRTNTAWDTERCIHELFEDRVDESPDSIALVFEGTSLTYGELDRRANALARKLSNMGVGPDDLVGVHVERSLDLLVATLGIMKAGGAYVPLDPDFPAERIAFMVQDSGARIIVTQQAIASALEEGDAALVRIDSEWADIEAEGSDRLDREVQSSNLAYAIYTSGSTGKPKGVLVEHRNVVNFFTGMDAVIHHDPPGAWLAVTSLSFDISVLELFWTLARGFKVVVYKERHRTSTDGRSAIAVSRGMEFGLFMWGNDDGPAPDKYDLMFQAARYFDSNGFDSVWTPERHFHAFGGPFPNPSVTGAALAAITENLAVRAGSCVSPLHHPVRIAEEWSVVDNISGGRVGLAFAAGWQPDDFLLRPESFPKQKQVMLEQIDTVRRLWRGEEVEFENPLGNPVAVTTLPRPVQSELPFWVTTAGNPDSYRAAGSMGANVLTHLLGQTFEEVAEKIAVYRKAREEAGFDPREGKVTLMLHTFVGDDDEEIRELVRQPMKDYLGASMKLVLGFAWTFPAFKRPAGPDSSPEDVDLSTLSEEETDAILDFAFERYFETSGLFGTPETCLKIIDQCKEIDVDEIACLLDYGVDEQRVLDSLPLLKRVRDEANAVAATDAPAGDFSLAAQVEDHAISHLQCTPSMAQMLAMSPDNERALQSIDHLMIGGEAFPPSLVETLSETQSTSITNMYGPTETTIWSATFRLPDDHSGAVPIGRPIANTSLYVLDRYLQPLPLGVPGELFIGGAGVTRGYHGRTELTADRFVSDPWAGDGARMYRTGDLVRYRDDGVLEFLGRIDHQVKIRGYRIELGEIESVLNTHEAISVCAVVVREPKPGDQRLIGYFVPAGDRPEDAALQQHLRVKLPEYMVPAHFVTMDQMPLTPNGKIDRKALPDLSEVAAVAPAVEYEPPANQLEQTIAQCWQTTLGLDRVGTRDNFFDIGGHSLLIVQLHRMLTEKLEESVSLVDLYRFPTIRSLTDHLGSNQTADSLAGSEERAEKRRQVMQRRRRRN